MSLTVLSRISLVILAFTNIHCRSEFVAKAPAIQPKPAMPPPTKFVASAGSATQINLSWIKPNVQGALTAYDISYQTPNGKTIKKEVKGNLLGSRVDGLTPWTNYTFSIQARNNTNSSVPVTARETTLMAAPSKVTSLSATTTGRNVTISWKKPDPANGPISGYSVTFPGGHNVTSVTYFVKGDLKENITYTFTVAGVNQDPRQPLKNLTGEVAVINVTPTWQPPSPGEIKYQNSSKHTIQFTYKKPLFTPRSESIIQHVLLVTAGQDLDKNAGSKAERLKTFKSWKEKGNSSEVYRSSPLSWSTETDSGICKSNGESFVCTVGAQEKCGDEAYCNGPLRKNTSYRVKVRAYTERGWSETAALEVKTNGGGQVVPMATSFILFSVISMMLHFS